MMRSKPLVSCIIPAYNREKMLPLSINSVLNQTYDNWELIVVDDRSTDSTSDVIKEYSRKDSRIKYIKNTRTQGPAGARNQGVKIARGKYLAFLDSDDEWKSFHLKELVEEMENNQDVGWIFGDGEWKENGSIIVNSYFREHSSQIYEFGIERRGKLNLLNENRLLEKAIKKGVPAGVQNSLIRKELFGKVMFDERVFGVEDALIVIDSIYNGFNLAYVDTPHITYNIHGDNISNSNRVEDKNKQLSINKELEKMWKIIIKELDLNNKQKRYSIKMLSDLYFWRYGYNIYINTNEKEKAKKYFLKGMRLQPLNMKYWKTYLKRILLTPQK